MPSDNNQTNPPEDQVGSAFHLVGNITDEPGTFLEKGSILLGKANMRITVRAAQRAFRSVSVISPTVVLPALNRYGTLQGMVTNAAWRHVFDVHIQYAKVIENAGKLGEFLGWASYLAGWGEEIEKVSHSSEPWEVKGQKLCFYATTALAKIFIGTAHGITDGVLYGAEGFCSIGGALGIPGVPSVSHCSNYGDVARAFVGVGFKAEEDFVSPENIRAGVIQGGGAALAAVWNKYDDAKYYISRQFK